MASAQPQANTSRAGSSRLGSSRFSSSQARSSPPATNTNDFSAKLLELMQQHARPERLARYRRVASVIDAADDVAGVMEEAVDRMLANAQNLNDLEDKSTWLLSQASAFQRSATENRRRACCRNLKLGLCISAGVLLVGGVVTLIVLRVLGIMTWP